MTVKKLLANKAEDSAEESSQTGALGTVPQGPIVVTSSSSFSSTHSSAGIISGNMVQRLVPPATVLRLPSQSSLDDALQTVVTSYHTTLPTADIKVPSPTTLPSLSPRKNVTRTVQSTKAPIPTTPRLQTEKKSVSLTKTIVSGGTTFTLGPNAVAAVIPGVSGAARPGTVVLPAGQHLASVDASGKKHVMLHVTPQGGNILQGYILPQGATVRTVRLSNPRTVPTGSSAPDVAPVVTPPVSSGGAQLPGNHAGPGLLTSLSPPLSAAGGPQQTATSKTTSEVLKSMLAARSLTNTVPTSLSASVAATLPGSITSSASISKPRTVSGSVLSQQIGAQVTQTSRLISTQVAGVTVPKSSQVVAANQGVAAANQGVVATNQEVVAANQGGVFLQTILPQLQSMGSLAVAGAPPRSNGAASQSLPAQNVVRMSVPMAALQPAASSIRLVAGQLGSSSAGSGQLAVASIKPGTLGLQQLQALVSPGSLQRMRTQLLPSQQANFVVDAGSGAGQALGGQTSPLVGGQTSPVVNGQTSQVVGGQTSQVVVGDAAAGQQLQQTLQLHFKVQPNGQVVASTTSASLMPPPALQGVDVKATAPKSQGIIPVLASSSVSLNNSAATAKVIMASPIPTTPQLSAASSLVASSCVKTHDTQTAVVAGNRLSLSVIPGPLSNQFTISPVPTQSSNNAGTGVLKHVSGGQLEASQVIPVGNGGGQVNPCVAPAVSATSSLQLQLGVKRSLSSSGVQPIPAKMAHVDSAGGNSGAVLASLSQMIGSSMNRNSDQAAGDAAVGSPVRGPLGGSVQRVVKASAVGDVDASSALQNLAAHVAPVSSNVMLAVSAPRDNSSASISPAVQGAAGTGNMAQILQQLAVVSPVSGAGTMPISLQFKPQRAVQEQVITMRQVGGQLLTPSNVPVTVHNNGEVKVSHAQTSQSV